MPGEPRGHAPGVDDQTDTAATAAARESEIAGPGDETPSARCPYCDRPFRRARLETLHRGREHLERLSDRERAAVERAVREERAELRRFRLYALGVLVVLYFGLLIVAAFVV